MKNRIGILYFSLFFLSFSLHADEAFNELWSQMQKAHTLLSAKEESSDNKYLVQQIWMELRQPIIKHILGEPDEYFLSGSIAGTMVAGNVSGASQGYILNESSVGTREKLAAFKDTDFGGRSKICQTVSALNCSSDSLRHLYFMARILDNREKPIHRMVEIGGGYGCLARIAKFIYPEITYIIIDLPEVLAIQKLFLQGSLSNTEIKVHTKAPRGFTKGCIHLVPYYVLPDLEIKNVDVFISVVALSETSEAMQNIVIKKQFYNAPICYVMGQKKHPRLLDEIKIVNAVKWFYPHHSYQPYNHYYGGCYEIMGMHSNKSLPIMTPFPYDFSKEKKKSEMLLTDISPLF